MKKNIITLSVLSLALFIISPGAAFSAGTAAGESLQIGAGARAAAMGEAFSAVADDASALYWNPAGLVKAEGRQLLIAHTAWFLDTAHEYIGYSQKLGAGCAGLSIMSSGSTFEKRAGDSETADSTPQAGDLSVGLSYAHPLVCGINAGATLKSFTSRLDVYTANTLCLDIGLQNAKPYWGKLTAGLSILDAGGSLKYISDPIPLASSMGIGCMAENLVNNLKVALDARLVAGVSTINLGMEYAWKAKENLVIYPRLGFMSAGSLATAGVGISLRSYKLDIAFLPQADLGGSTRVSFGIDF